MKNIFILYILLLPNFIKSQFIQQTNNDLEITKFENNTKSSIWLSISEDALGRPINIPVIVLKGKTDFPIVGITAAIHGDEVNGTAIVHQVIDKIDINKLNGIIIAFPLLNPYGFQLNQRDDLYQQDLNRIFPGKANGTESEQFVWALKEKILPQLNVLIDIHTASFGRINSMYVRANLKNDTLAQMAKLMEPDIILDSREASAGIITTASKTLRQEAQEKGIHCITLEAGNPQVIQSDMTHRGSEGILRILNYFNIYKSNFKKNTNKAKYCHKSYWLYTQKGGILEVIPNLSQRIKKDEIIAIQKDLFGNEIAKYYAPEDGIIIGKSTNPVAATGGRIIHLGIEK